MMFSEAEAGSKWCRHARVPVEVVSGSGGVTVAAVAVNVNPYARPERALPGCIGSRCASWRWGESEFIYSLIDGDRKDAAQLFRKMEDDGWTHFPDGDEKDQHKRCYRLKRAQPRRGYCGADSEPRFPA